MAPVGLFLLLYLTGGVIARKPVNQTSVSCLLVDLDYVHCSWDGQNTEVNYTFYSRFHSDNNFQECTSYTSENGYTTGCMQPYNKLETQRFLTFYTNLTHDYGYDYFLEEHNLKTKVKLYPPVNMTVKNDSNNLCFYWNHTNGWYQCLENEVSYRTNNNKWESSRFSRQSHCTNLASSNSHYELRVRFKVASHCGESIYWSDWSQLVYNLTMKSSDTRRQQRGPMSVWSVVFSVVGTCILLLVLITLVHHDRIRIILIPVVPKPGKNLNGILIDGNVEEWLHISKGLKEGFKADYNERACAVNEYSRVPQSASESSDSSSSSSVTTDQTDCSVATSANESE